MVYPFFCVLSSGDAFGLAEQDYWASLYEPLLPSEDKKHADEPWSDFMVSYHQFDFVL
jgi:hypothetical protein